MNYFSDEKVNTGRQPEVDLMKAVCIIGMIFVHVLLDLSADSGSSSSLTFGDYSTEFLGAANFMVCMGIGMRYSRNQTAAGYLTRGIAILTIGQLLNLLRNALPNLIAWWILGKQWFIANSFLVIQADILTFAGLAFLLMAALRSFRLSGIRILYAGLALSLFALAMYNLVPASPSNYLISQLAGFFIITDAEAYFPLCCYFIFVAFGYFIGGWYPKIKDKKGLSTRIIAVCLPIAAAYYVFRFLVPVPFLPALGADVQYSLKPTPDAIATCLTTLVLLAVFYKIIDRFGGKLPNLLQNFSTYINSYYCVSYLFILPVQTILMAATGTLWGSALLLWGYSFLVLILCYLIINLNEKKLHFHFTNLKGKQLTIFLAAVWIATIAVVIYAYPRIETFANFWNEYLL